jgi:uncharacterized membrane protein
MAILLLVQIFHILTGTIWLCSFIFIYFILWPSFVKVNSIEVLAIKESLKKPIASILGVMGIISITLGIIRGVFWGGITSLQSFVNPYGRNFLAAILISIIMIIIGRIYGHSLVKIPWKTENEKREILFKIYMAGGLILACYALLLLCMVGMRFGGI